ncbi:ABC transporter ATP-binding protein [Ruminococcus flavefaciens]|uniref:ABC-2 type transport system ATP-binding protein n=1 Tax=Ruminococcus flavefaciens TaxID=1265 RepID=A0A1M7LF92_RUMFL|nr:ATP-binding cassette domain-containing protein [Ruminococcus flavefaciens]SHM76861.1 ABC-2 type transport system ATP-binding protein [Ruminococcus flavefaciens]
MINIENLTKYYGSNRAVNHISFTINDNEILGFLGPNGAGKSTTMNMIAGYLPMSDGTVTIYGADITKDPVKAKRNIGYLPEIPPVYPDMKVKEYLSFCAGLKRVPRGERKSEIERVMGLLKIKDVSGKLIRNLSKGYKQRVGFAQALLGNPKFLILDEPTVGLDPNQVAEVRAIIKDLKKEHSVIFSSHILSEVSAVCDRVIIINKGDIRAIDTIENLEKSFATSLVLHIKVKGDKDLAASIIGMTKGVKEIKKIEDEGSSIFSFTVDLEGDSDAVRDAIMSDCLKNGISILEMFTDKPNLENVFIELINRPAKKNGLQELLDEMPDESEKTAETTETTETKEEE